MKLRSRKFLGSGFTLVEVLTTLVILSFGIIAIHRAFGRSIEAAKHSEEALFTSHLLGAPVALAALDGWSSKKELSLQRDSTDFEDTAGCAYATQMSDMLVLDLPFKRYGLEMKTPTGRRPVNAVLLLPDVRGKT